MTTPMARDRIGALVAGLEIPVGIHAHENLSLSVANSARRAGSRQRLDQGRPRRSRGGACPVTV